MCTLLLWSCKPERISPEWPDGQFTIGDSQNEVPFDGLALADGTFLVAAGKQQDNGNYDAWLFQMDNQGFILRERFFEDPQFNSYGKLIVSDGNGGYWILVEKGLSSSYRSAIFELVHIDSDWNEVQSTRLDLENVFSYNSNSGIQNIWLTPSGKIAVHYYDYQNSIILKYDPVLNIQEFTAPAIQNSYLTLNVVAEAPFGGFVELTFTDLGQGGNIRYFDEEFVEISNGPIVFDNLSSRPFTSYTFNSQLLIDTDSILYLAIADEYNASYLYKFEDDGTILQQRELQGDFYYSMAESTNGEIFLAGSSEPKLNYDQSRENSDIISLRINTNLELIGAQSNYGADENEYFYALVPGLNGQFLTLATTVSNPDQGIDIYGIITQP